MNSPLITALPLPPDLLGESPVWHPEEAALYWCDIPGKQLHRYHPDSGAHRQWAFDCEPACIAPLLGGDLLLGMRDGLWRFDPASGRRERLAEPPYDVAKERFNDGKADPQGRFWVGTIYEPRSPALAALYRFAGDRRARGDGRGPGKGLVRMADGITVSNGLAWSPDGATMYWSDTASHTIFAFDFDGSDDAGGALSRQRVFASFAPKQPGQDLDHYGGRPDGAAVDSEGAYWSAMFEGQRLLRFAPSGAVLSEISLPARCPTMPCFGGADLRTLYVTTARENRPADELAALPLSGCVLQLRVEVPGLPVNFARL
jgi:sugar lactone lactonase YvrE